MVYWCDRTDTYSASLLIEIYIIGIESQHIVSILCHGWSELLGSFWLRKLHIQDLTELSLDRLNQQQSTATSRSRSKNKSFNVTTFQVLFYALRCICSLYASLGPNL